jgi:hypothetical protein
MSITEQVMERKLMTKNRDTQTTYQPKPNLDLKSLDARAGGLNN